ncbi:unnamed protein product [Spirodela intermedia]|uniref:Uncharacterized protein n=1 Tax=Spirodela intermedia TaxID=51605 RepID=A0A7I8LP03_SPIIN|nr:unnamed protein product [Spirodela intermedia]
MKWVVELSLAAVTRRSGKMATLRLSSNCHSTERSWMKEVATGLLADRPLPDDGLFVDQSEMIYSMDSRSFYRESGLWWGRDVTTLTSWLEILVTKSQHMPKE